MARTVATEGLKVQEWDDKFFREYLQENPFKPYFGGGHNSAIQVREKSASRYEKITFSLVNRLKNDPVTGSDTLEGNEESAVGRSFFIQVDKRRNGVVSTEIEEQYSAIDLRNAKRDVLMDWAMEDTRDRIIESLGSIDGVAYASATEAQKDAWLANNSDRVLFGGSMSNNSSNDHSASLANIDTTDDKLTPDLLELLKRMAGTADPKIKPLRVSGMNQKFYVAFCSPLAMRDLKRHTDIRSSLRQVSLKNENNRLFKGGDIEWDGVIVHEVEDIPTYSGVGASSSDVSPVYLMGQQAIGYALAKRWNTVDQLRDYKDKHGLAVQEIGGIAKILFGSGTGDTDNLKDHGVATAYVSTPADV